MKAATMRPMHDCRKWTYHAGMATCPHGFELFPNGATRRVSVARWKSHRSAIAAARKVSP